MAKEKKRWTLILIACKKQFIGMQKKLRFKVAKVWNFGERFVEVALPICHLNDRKGNKQSNPLIQLAKPLNRCTDRLAEKKCHWGIKRPRSHFLPKSSIET